MIVTTDKQSWKINSRITRLRILLVTITMAVALFSQQSMLPVALAPDDTLGQHLYSTFDEAFGNEIAWEGRGSEFIGTVSPTNFDPSQFSSSSDALHFKREITSGKRYNGLAGDQLYKTYTPGTEDNSPPQYRDDNPTDSSAHIYDLDLPGVDAFFDMTANIIYRIRINFNQWADWKGQRCSLKEEWYTRQSYKRTGPLVYGWTSSADEDSLTDTTKSWGTLAPGAVKILLGPGDGQVRRITSNTPTTLAVANDWEDIPQGPPPPTSGYVIVVPSTWTEINDVSGDNVSADGTTNITWDLE